MRRRLLLSYLSITVFVLLVLEIPLGFAYAQSERRRLTSAVQHDALALSIRAEDAIESSDLPRLQRTVDAYKRDTGGRVVVVNKDGTLLADSDPVRPGPRNFGSRPELRAALRGREVSGTRRSETLGETLQYFAVPIVHGNGPIGALRVTYPTSFVDARIRRTWWVLAGVGAIILGIVFLVSLRLARQVTKPLDDLERAAARFGHGELEARANIPSGPPEIRELTESFNRTAERLEELVSSQQAFVADASHQLRTPLAALRLRLENLEGEIAETSGPAAEDVGGALTEVARLSRLVDGLLELARAERSSAGTASIELRAVVDGRVDAWSALAAERTVDLVTELDAGLVVRSAPGRLEQVLDNLLANALDVAPPQSEVRVTGKRRGDRVELSVLDAGPGMSAAQRARAFDRFWRPSGSDRDGGSGLGLAIVHQLVAADGGVVELDAAPGGGLAARVVLRRA
ncbi:MAG: ATP-binding protein [Acidimicrobiia bacterium]